MDFFPALVFFLPLIVLRLSLFVYIRRKSPGRSIPGPRAAAWSRLWYFLHVRSGKFHLENIALHARYGPIVRVGPNLYSIDYPDKDIYGIGSRFAKSDWYEGWKHPSPDRWTLFPDQNIKRHAETRKRFQNLYSMSSLVSYETHVNECIEIFFDKLTSFAESGELINLAHWFQCYAFDVIGNITYSERFGFLDEGEDISGIMTALDKSMVYSTLVGVYAWAHPYLYPIMEKIPGSGAAARTFLMKFVQRKIKDRNLARDRLKTEKRIGEVEAKEDAPRDFLDKLTKASEQDPQRVTEYHIFMMGLSNIIAGSDTTAVSLSSILYHLIKNPSALAKLRREIQKQDAAHGSFRKQISFKEAAEMTFLQAVIKEALRLHAATGLPLWRVVPKGGANIAGYQLPAGAIVGINSWVAHYKPDIFGPDADAFRPERWLEVGEDKTEQSRRMEANYMPFGLGSRTCLGRHISMLEMCKLVPEIVRSFDFEIDGGSRTWKTRNYWFVKPEDFRVWVKVRS